MSKQTKTRPVAKKAAKKSKTSKVTSRETSADPMRVPMDGARDKIKNTAVKLFAEKGLDGVSVRDISTAAGVNVSLISYYFGGKENLFRAILDEHFIAVRSDLLKTMSKSVQPTASRENFRAEMGALIRYMVEMRLSQPSMAKLIQRDRLNGLPFTRQIFEEMSVPLTDAMVSIIERAKKAGVVRKELNNLTYLMTILESIWGFCALQDAKLKAWKDAYRFPKDKEDYIEFLTRLYTEGIYK